MDGIVGVGVGEVSRIVCWWVSGGREKGGGAIHLNKGGFAPRRLVVRMDRGRDLFE